MQRMAAAIQAKDDHSQISEVKCRNADYAQSGAALMLCCICLCRRVSALCLAFEGPFAWIQQFASLQLCCIHVQRGLVKQA